jgi:nucleotide-binding universal stress UspA family protein
MATSAATTGSRARASARVSTVVVGTDCSERNAAARSWAAAEAAASGGRLLLVHAVDDFVLSVPQVPRRDGESDAAKLERVRRDLGHLLPLARVDVHTVTGAPAPMLLHRSSDARLVVVGRRGLGGFSRLLVGSTSMAVAARSEVPVVVVPTGWQQEPDAPSPIVLGIDTNRSDTRVIRFALTRARRLGVPLIAVTAWDTYGAGWSHSDLVSTFETWERTAKADLVATMRPWQMYFTDVDIHLETRHGNAAMALLEVAEDAQLVVVGRHRNGVLGGFPIGSTARAVLAHSNCPVAVIPQDS